MGISEKKKEYLKKYYKEKLKKQRQEKALQNHEVVKSCPVCGNSFVATSNGQKYCTKECAKEYKRQYQEEYRKKNKEKLTQQAKEYRQTEQYKENKRNYQKTDKFKAYLKEKYQERRQQALQNGTILVYTKICATCGKEFTTTRKNKINCSDECTRKYNSTVRWKKQNKQETP